VLALLYQFEHSEWWPREMLERQQLRQLEVLVNHVGETVPGYAQTLRDLRGLTQGELTWERWRRLPVLERSALRADRQALTARAVPKDHLPLIDVSTSGSTGSPITVKSTNATRLFFQALMLRYHLWHGRDFALKACAVMVPSPGESTAPVGWAPAFQSGPMQRFDAGQPVSAQFEWLVHEAPAYLLTYPNVLRELLRFSARQGRRIPGLRQVATMAEVLDDDLRAMCMDRWEVPVTDAYSAQEVGFIALQCPDHPVYHAQAESVLVEVLRADGGPCAPGEVGRVVVTDLKNYATPLIRYALGDYAEVGGACACGRGLPVLTRILGRSRNMLRLADGDSRWPRFGSGRLGKFDAIRQFQLVQTGFHDITVNLVLARPLQVEEAREIRRLIGAEVGADFALHLCEVPEIPRSPNGKFEDFRCDIAGP
jgi:phenylacetate-CoA ligase